LVGHDPPERRGEGFAERGGRGAPLEPLRVAGASHGVGESHGQLGIEIVLPDETNGAVDDRGAHRGGHREVVGLLRGTHAGDHGAEEGNQDRRNGKAWTGLHRNSPGSGWWSTTSPLGTV